MPSKVNRKLDDKRLGLLMRMCGFRAVVCTKKIAEPLLKRGLVKQVRQQTFEITKSGRTFAEEQVKAAGSKGKMIETYSLLCIGNAVGIVTND